MTQLEISGLSVSYGGSRVLRHVDLTIESGQDVGVVGPNGAGKTTLLNAISGLKEYEGSIQYDGVEVSETTTDDLVESGLVQVSEEGNLFGPMTVEQNLKLGAVTNQAGFEEQLDRVYSIFDRLEDRKSQVANTLSGGEQQMLAIGRGLMADPELLMIDEPTQGLAPVVVDDLSAAFEGLYDDLTVLIVEQNAFFVFEHTQTVHLLENGEITRSGPASELQDDDYIRDAYLGVE